MARPPEADPERTKGRLIASATELFSQYGLEGTSLRRVAAGAGVTMPTIHHYFGNKQKLYEATMQAAWADLGREVAPVGAVLAEVADALPRNAGSGDALSEVVDNAIRVGLRGARRQPAALRLVMRPVVETGSLDPTWSHRTLVPFLERVGAWLAPRVSLPPTRIRLRLQALVALGMRYCLSTPTDLALLAGLPCPETDETVQSVLLHVEDELVAMTSALLELDRPPPGASSGIGAPHAPRVGSCVSS